MLRIFCSVFERAKKHEDVVVSKKLEILKSSDRCLQQRHAVLIDLAILCRSAAGHEVLVKIVMTAATLTKLNTIWKDKAIKLSSKIRLMRSLVNSVFLYACETWSPIAELEKRVQILEMRRFKRLLGISYKNHITNGEVRNRIKQASGPYEDLLSTIKRRN